LREMEIACTDTEGEDGSPVILPAYESSLFTTVRSLKLDGLSWRGCGSWMLENLEIHIRAGSEDPWSEGLQTLWDGLPNLRTLGIRLDEDLELFVSQHHLVFPELTTLKLEGQDIHYPNLLPMIDAPKLNTLDLKIDATRDLEHYTFLSPFTSRFPIRDLTIRRSITPASATRLLEMIRATPSIQSLTIECFARDHYPDRDVLRALPDVLVELPNLASVRLEKGCLHTPMLGALSRLTRRIELHVSTCSIYLPDDLGEIEWDVMEETVKDTLALWVDLRTWEDVSQEVIDATGQFDYW